jgi:NifB/MoaA-like Fe-S oxidoreductase
VSRSLSLIFGLMAAVAVGAAAHARDFEMGGDTNYSIMAPEPGATNHHRATVPARTSKSLRTIKPSVRTFYPAHGSSGLVEPTPLPRTQAIPLEGNSAPMLRSPLQEQGPTILPGLNPIPNLPHGTETFQDRASRCAQQQALYNVPAGSSALYMHTCSM